MPGLAQAGAWNQPAGHGQVIVKYEPMWASHVYDEDGDRIPRLHGQEDQVVSVWAEYGLSDRLTLILKSDWQDVDDGERTYQGAGPVEMGGRWRLWSGERGVAAIQATYVSDTGGRNAAWGSPGEGEQEFDLRFLAGRNFTVRNKPYFVEAQLARRWRDSLPDDTRMEVTFGSHISSKYSLLTQFYAGSAEDAPGGKGAYWVVSEGSVVRHWKDWSAQLGWRSTYSGRKVNDGAGPVVALWRRF